MKIYTKGGDKGRTSLVCGTRVSKAHPRVCAYGDIDELVSHIGVLRAEISTEQESAMLRRIQEQLMLGSAHVAAEKETSKLKSMDETEIGLLESEIDRMTSAIPPQTMFVLPAGPRVASDCHIARSVCRRAERSVVAFGEESGDIRLVQRYLNRLSDYLFILARYLCYLSGVEEDFWLP